MLYLGWLGTCSHHVMTISSHHKPLWSFSFQLVVSLYALINDVLSLCMIMAIIALLVCRSQSFASLHNKVWVPLMHPTPNKTKLSQRVHHTYLLEFSTPSIFMFLSTFWIKLVMWKLVIKALTNLMAHFTFLDPNKLEPLCHLCCIACTYLLGISRTMLSWGTLSTLHFVLVSSWYHALLYMDVVSVKWKGSL